MAFRNAIVQWHEDAYLQNFLFFGRERSQPVAADDLRLGNGRFRPSAVLGLLYRYILGVKDWQKKCHNNASNNNNFKNLQDQTRVLNFDPLMPGK